GAARVHSVERTKQHASDDGDFGIQERALAMRTIARRWRAEGVGSVLRNWRGDPAGSAAAEFALILPIALFLFTGTITYGNAIYIDRKVTLTARTVTDLVTQYSSVANT